MSDEWSFYAIIIMLPRNAKPWKVITIPTSPSSDNHIELYKRIRLAGLLLDPAAFGSTYTKESAYTQETWRSRIDNKERITLLATDGMESEVIGTLSILCPAMLSTIPQDPSYPPSIAEKEKVGQVEVYMLVGMWVHPDHRGKGVGRGLVNQVLETINITPSRMPVLNSAMHPSLNTTLTRIALLLVHNDQQAAIHLYQASGFIKQGETEHGGRPSTWMAAF